MKRNFWFCIMTIFGSSAYAYIYEAVILKTWNENAGRYHFFIGLSDFHDKSHPINQSQAAMLDHLISLCDNQTTKIVLEDLSSSSERSNYKKFYINSRGGILGGLASRYAARGFDVENVEYRYCRVCSLAPVLNNIHKKPHAFPSVRSTSIKELSQEIDVTVQEINAYTDGTAWDNYYQKGIRHLEPDLKSLALNKHTQLSVADYVDIHTTSANRLEFLKYLLTFDSSLLDLKMVHAIINALNKHEQFKQVVAISGGAHIERVVKLLQERGYTLVYTSNTKFCKEYDLKKCVGSTIVDGEYCIRPEPIELEAIANYLCTSASGCMR